MAGFHHRHFAVFVGLVLGVAVALVAVFLATATDERRE
jgi:uncharacterized protein involved in exopolysaccharide biosynthesis